MLNLVPGEEQTDCKEKSEQEEVRCECGHIAGVVHRGLTLEVRASHVVARVGWDVGDVGGRVDADGGWWWWFAAHITSVVIVVAIVTHVAKSTDHLAEFVATVRSDSRARQRSETCRAE